MRLVIDTTKLDPDNSNSVSNVEAQVLRSVARMLDEYGRTVVGLARGLEDEIAHGERVRSIAREIRWLVRSDFTEPR